MGRETILHPAEQSCPKTRDSALFRLTIAYWLQPYGNMSKNMQQKLRRHAVEYHMGITYICSISVENASMKFVIAGEVSTSTSTGMQPPPPPPSSALQLSDANGRRLNSSEVRRARIKRSGGGSAAKNRNRAQGERVQSYVDCYLSKL